MSCGLAFNQHFTKIAKDSHQSTESSIMLTVLVIVNGPNKMCLIIAMSVSTMGTYVLLDVGFKNQLPFKSGAKLETKNQNSIDKSFRHHQACSETIHVSSAQKWLI